MIRGLNERSATLTVYLNYFQPALCLKIKVQMEEIKNKKQNMQGREREREEAGKEREVVNKKSRCYAPKNGQGWGGGGGVGGHMETHPLIAGGKQRSNGVTETQERRPLLRLAVPALHHHLIPEKAKAGVVTTLSCTACPAPRTMTQHVLADE